MLNKILLTGETGFIGNAIQNETSLIKNQFQLITFNKKEFPRLTPNSSFENKLNGISYIIHCANVAHTHLKNNDDYLTQNTKTTLNLAKQAEKQGVKRFIYLSSIKVNGETSPINQPFSERDTPHPQDAYGESKYQTENELLMLSENSNMDVVIIRPPLVYGDGVKANFQQLLKISQSKMPMPFGSLNQLRSFIYIENLVSFIFSCVTHPNAKNQIFTISDGEDISVSELIIRMANINQHKMHLISVPIWSLKLLGKITGKQDAIEKLCSPLQVDPSKAQNLLNWTPPYTLEEGLTRTVLAFNKAKHHE